MAERWDGMAPFGSRGEELLKEIDEVLAHTQNQKLKVEGTYVKAKAQLIRSQQKTEGKADLSAVDAFLQLAPKDPRASRLIYMAATSAGDQKAKTAFEDRLLKDFPDSQFATMVKGARRHREGIGKPFELEFTDAISGTHDLDERAQGQGRGPRLLGHLVRPLRGRDAQDEGALREVPPQGG